MNTSTISRRAFIHTMGMGACAVALPSQAYSSTDKPNIVLIMADDMGFSDIGCYGGEINTPNLDRLAQDGVRFTNFYNTARCCPTRSSLLTGLYSHQCGMGLMTSQDRGHIGYRGEINNSCVTIAEALKPAGYETYMSGKWHQTRYDSLEQDSPKHSWPRQRGFDHFYGIIRGGGNFYNPRALARENTLLGPQPKGFYLTDAISNNAVQYIQKHKQESGDKPFFLYVAYTAPHWPLHAPAKDIARYRGKYLKGWDKLREERHARMKNLGLVDESMPLTARDKSADAWDSLDEKRKDNMDHRMAIYAAQVDIMDQGIGRIVKALKEAGRFDNTLILFLSDNGASAEGGKWGFDHKKGGVLGEDSSHSSYGLSWANASNTPFRLYKKWVHEGGISTPLIAHWSARIKDRGKFRRQVGHVIDIMPTCLQVAGARYPSKYKGNLIHPVEGTSLLSALDNQKPMQRTIFWEHRGNCAVREGRWKLVSKYPKDWELYNLENDRSETKNLAKKHPEIAKRLLAKYNAWAQRCNVLPWPVRKNEGSDELVFNLKQGAKFERKHSPRVAGKPILITAVILPQKPNGVILSQGGSTDGYALYIKDGRLAMATCHKEKRTVIIAPEKLPPGEVKVEGKLDLQGAITLKVNGQTVSTGKTPGPMRRMPQKGLEAGADSGGPGVGKYKTPNTFKGTISNLRLSLEKQ
jgi:arylsulfatase A-like enzyme